MMDDMNDTMIDDMDISENMNMNDSLNGTDNMRVSICLTKIYK